MKTVILSPRLRRIADLVENTRSLADVGTDHGYLPYVLLEEGRISNALLCDVNEGPLNNAKAAFVGSPFESQVLYRLGSGLEVFSAGEAEAVVIAGMGGALIIALLEAAMPQVESVKQLILQPMTEQAAVRAWLLDKGYSFSDHFAIEGAKHYEIINVTFTKTPHNVMAIADITPLTEFGYSVSTEDKSDYIVFLNGKRAKYLKIAEALSNHSEKNAQRLTSCQAALESIEKVLTHLTSL